MDVPTDRLCVCVGGGDLPPSLKTLFLFLTQPEGTSNDMCISRKNLCLFHKNFWILSSILSCLSLPLRHVNAQKMFQSKNLFQEVVSQSAKYLSNKIHTQLDE